MAEQKLRLTKRHVEIQHLLDTIPPQTLLTLWTVQEGHRSVFHASLIKVDHAHHLIYLQTQDEPADLASQTECFIKLKDSEGVSKCHINLLKDKMLVLEISDELILSERRLHRRIQFRSEDDKKLTLQVGDEKLTAAVDNASRNGMRIKLSPVEVAKLSKLSSFKLIQLGEARLEIDCSPIWGKDQLLSFRLNQDLSEDQFKEFSQVPRSMNVEPEKFFNDQEYFETVRSNMKTIIANLEKRPKLASAMKTLKINREGNYIKTHIDLLCYVSCSLGKTLGWVTDSTIDKLIYVSYLHDLRYFETPHLARISSLAAFNEKKSSLSPEEQKIFLEGPAYSSLMAKDDEMSSIDVERILIQQKERPDGSGFPAGITFKQLFPLSCLFIISHEFVDYIYSTSNWNFKDFVAEARTIFKGPYFIKILQAFEELDQSRSKY